MGTPIVHEDTLYVYAVDVIADADHDTITPAEISAGVDLTDALRADGYSPSHTENTVSTQMLRGWIAQSIGTEGVSFNLTFQRFLDDTTVWDYFDAKKFSHLVVSPYGPAVAGATVEIYPVNFGRRKGIASGADTHQGFTVLCTGIENYNDDVTVAA